jgi:hypothetical protein
MPLSVMRNNHVICYEYRAQPATTTWLLALAREFQAALYADLSGDYINLSLTLAHILWTSKPAYHQLAQRITIVVVGLKEQIMVVGQRIRNLSKLACASNTPTLESCEQNELVSQSRSIVLVRFIYFILLISLFDSSTPNLCESRRTGAQVLRQKLLAEFHSHHWLSSSLLWTRTLRVPRSLSFS